MKIVPSILTEKFDDFTARLREAESFADYVQIDITDGIFVETRSFPVEKINSVNTPLSFEAHLMVDDPLSFMSGITHPGLRKVIFHFEAAADHGYLINRIRTRGLLPGMAVKPGTRVEQFREAAEQADTLLFLTVDPCCYGHPFKPEVLKKVAEARKVFPEKVISVDGGVSHDNLRTLSDIGVDYVCVGSRIFLNGDPRENYLRFAEELKEIEKG
jgi:ribulose-phosphate 3-epimerase